jgi:hypothetical protein
MEYKLTQKLIDELNYINDKYKLTNLNLLHHKGGGFLRT